MKTIIFEDFSIFSFSFIIPPLTAKSCLSGPASSLFLLILSQPDSNFITLYKDSDQSNTGYQIYVDALIDLAAKGFIFPAFTHDN